jgi:hypothetical protein
LVITIADAIAVGKTLSRTAHRFTGSG